MEGGVPREDDDDGRDDTGVDGQLPYLDALWIGEWVGERSVSDREDSSVPVDLGSVSCDEREWGDTPCRGGRIWPGTLVGCYWWV
jgi:hypothetical protein